MTAAAVPSAPAALGLAAALSLAETSERPRPFRTIPFRWLSWTSLPLTWAALPLSSFASLSASLRAFRSALTFRRNRSARASARFLLRFLAQDAHLHPIGLR